MDITFIQRQGYVISTLLIAKRRSATMSQSWNIFLWLCSLARFMVGMVDWISRTRPDPQTLGLGIGTSSGGGSK